MTAETARPEDETHPFVRPAGAPAAAGWSVLSATLVVACAAYLLANAFAGLRLMPSNVNAAGLTAEGMWAFDAEHGQVGASWTGEFLPRWVGEERWAIGREPSGRARNGAAAVPPGVPLELEASPLAFGHLFERVRVTAPEPTSLVFHVFYYPAWAVTVDGRSVPTYPVGDLGLLAAEIPAGQHLVERSWRATPVVWGGRALAWLGWLSVLAILWRDRRSRGRRVALAAWVLAGLGALSVVSGLFATERSVQPLAARYGQAVNLQGAAILPVGQGQALPLRAAVVRLYWLVLDSPEPLTAFVHVVGSDGRVVAQHDGPLGGQYTPSTRWLPGELLPDEHLVQIPSDLPLGRYAVKVGLYRPGTADEPLTPIGGDPADPRVLVGVLELAEWGVLGAVAP